MILKQVLRMKEVRQFAVKYHKNKIIRFFCCKGILTAWFFERIYIKNFSV